MNFSNFSDLDWLTLAAGISAFLIYGTFWFVLAERSHDMKRERALKSYVSRMQQELGQARRRTRPQLTAKSTLRTIVEKLNLLKSHHAESIQTNLTLAGMRSKDALVVYLFAKMVLPLVLGAVAAVVVFVFNIGELGLFIKVFICGFVLLLASYLPDIFVKNMIGKRQQGLLEGVPDALDLMVICAEAGLGLAAALKRVAGEMDQAAPEIADEFSLTAAELGFLPDRRTALENLAKRTDMQQIRSVVNTLLQSEKYGTPLADSLRVLAEEYRDERMLRAEEKAAKLPATLTVPMVLFILPSLFIVLLAPAIIRTMDSWG